MENTYLEAIGSIQEVIENHLSDYECKTEEFDLIFEANVKDEILWFGASIIYLGNTYSKGFLYGEPEEVLYQEYRKTNTGYCFPKTLLSKYTKGLATCILYWAIERNLVEQPKLSGWMEDKHAT